MEIMYIFSNQHKKNNKIIISLVVVSLIILGSIMSFQTISGKFDAVHEVELKTSKQYFVSYTKPSGPIALNQGDTITWSGETGFLELYAKISLFSSAYSPNNPIDISIELKPDVRLSGFESDVWEVLPEDYFVFLPNAHYFDISTKQIDKIKPVIIPLKKSYENITIFGSSTIVYPSSGNYEVYILDPRELSEFSELISKQNIMNDDPVELTYTINDDVGKSILQNNGDIPIIEIGSSNDLNDVIKNRESNFHSWLAFTIGVPGVVFAYVKFGSYLRKHPSS